MRAYDGFFLLKNADVTIDLSVAELFVIKVAKGCWNLVFAFVIE